VIADLGQLDEHPAIAARVDEDFRPLGDVLEPEGGDAACGECGRCDVDVVDEEGQMVHPTSTCGGFEEPIEERRARGWRHQLDPTRSDREGGDDRTYREHLAVEVFAAKGVAVERHQGGK